MKRPLALIVDDEPDIRELLEITLGRMNIDTSAAADLETALKLLETEQFDLCLTDMQLPDGVEKMAEVELAQGTRLTAMQTIGEQIMADFAASAEAMGATRLEINCHFRNDPPRRAAGCAARAYVTERGRSPKRPFSCA